MKPKFKTNLSVGFTHILLVAAAFLAAATFAGQSLAHEIILEWNSYLGYPRGRNDPYYKRILRTDDRIILSASKPIGNGGSYLWIGQLNDQRDGFSVEHIYGDSSSSYSVRQLHQLDDQIIAVGQNHRGVNYNTHGLMIRYFNDDGDSIAGFYYRYDMRDDRPRSRNSFLRENGDLDIFLTAPTGSPFHPFTLMRTDSDNELIMERHYDSEADLGIGWFDYENVNWLSSATMLRDGDYILCGKMSFRRYRDEHNFYPGSCDCLMRLNPEGDIVWFEMNPDSLNFNGRYAYTQGSILYASLEHSSGAIYAVGTGEFWTEPRFALTLYKYSSDGSKEWVRRYNHNFRYIKFYRIFELRPDLLALFGELQFRGDADADSAGLWVALVDTAGNWLTDKQIVGDNISIYEKWEDIVRIDSNRVLAITYSYGRVLSIRFDLDPPNEVVEETVATPEQFALTGAYPNPFNATTAIGYSLPVAGNVRVAVYDLAGREVARLVEDFQIAGEHSTSWDASAYPTGLYFCRLQAGANASISKMMLVK